MITYRGEQIAVLPLLRPVAPTLQRFGSVGETTYTYQVVAVLSTGHTEASPVATITNGSATLSQLHAIDIIPPYVQGAASYDIYRVSGGLSQGKIGSVTARNSGTIQQARFRDRGQEGDDADAPSVNTTGALYLGGTAEANRASAALHVAHVTLSDAQIRALPTTPVEIVAPTEILAYAGLPLTLPVLVVAPMLLVTGTQGYGSVDGAAGGFQLWYGADRSQVASLPWPISPVNADYSYWTTLVPPLASGPPLAGANNILAGNLQDNGLYLAFDNNDAGGLTDGDAANTLRVSVYYVVWPLS